MGILFILAAIIAIGAYIIWTGNKVGPPKPERMTYSQIMNRLSSESAWLSRYARHASGTDAALIDKANGKHEYIHCLRAELGSRLAVDLKQLDLVLAHASGKRANGTSWEQSLIEANIEYKAEIARGEAIQAEQKAEQKSRIDTFASLSSDEKWCLDQSQALLQKLMPTNNFMFPVPKKESAMVLFLEVRNTAQRLYGEDICRKTRGDELITDPDYMRPRLASGLTVDEVRNYWNQPLLMALLIPEIYTLFKSLSQELSMKIEKITAVEAERKFRFSNIVYGDPVIDAKTIIELDGNTEHDVAIFIEFSHRINVWFDHLSDLDRFQIFSVPHPRPTSRNAKIRDLIDSGTLKFKKPRVKKLAAL